VVLGCPEIVGGVFAGGVAGAAVTAIVKAARDALDFPSLTLIVTGALDLPASPAAGVPESKPDAGSKVAHVGLLVISNVRGSPSASEALGWNL
jgi:hypothetical protein